MSDRLESFEICKKIPEIIAKQIKLFYIFDNNNNQNVLFVTNDDNVYGFGENKYGMIGLGHYDKVSKPTLIEPVV